ncbi:C40 family peptidase [Echinicola sediminis]
MRILNTLSILSLLLLLVFFSACQEGQQQDISPILSQIKEQYAPDKRVAVWDIEWTGDTLKGETNLPQALTALAAKLDSAGMDYVNAVNLLPQENLEGKHRAVVTLSVANIRSAPKHSAELATQATMGTPLQVLKKEDSWYLVQTPDKYISWVDAAGIEVMDERSFQTWDKAEKVVFTGLLGYVYEDQSEAAMVSDLTAGNLLELLDTDKEHYRVQLPDGRSGYIKKETAQLFGDWISSRELTDEKLISTAHNMMGVPYLWGGTSIKGVDCSGFTKTIYFLNGQVIPRDASQQIMEGELVDTDKDWKNLKVGDLLFFGRKATEDSPERVVHVGMWIGNDSFIHSRGRVRVSSFDPESPHYDAYELGRYLRTKRIRKVDSEHVLSVDQALH